MSRFGEWDYEEPFPNAAALWQANVSRALKGRRGRKALAELREALRALPEKKLIEGALCTVGSEKRAARLNYSGDELREKVERDGEGVCAVGAYVWFKRVKAGADPQEAFDSLPTLLDVDGGEWETAEAGKQAGLTYTLATTLAYRNDASYEDMTPEERYEKFMAWLDEQLTGASSPVPGDPDEAY